MADPEEIQITLNLFAVNGRYPGDLPEIDIPTARKYYKEADTIRQVLLDRIRA